MLNIKINSRNEEIVYIATIMQIKTYKLIKLVKFSLIFSKNLQSKEDFNQKNSKDKCIMVAKA